MMYREALPKNCPPPDAQEIESERIVYRLVRNNPPTEDDFRSQRLEHPESNFRNITECQARGLSVFADLEETRSVSERPGFQGAMTCQITLASGAGKIILTGRKSHHTWWPLASFNIIAHSRMVIP